MGGEYQEKVFLAETEEDLLDQYRKYQEQQAWDYGHAGYTGTFYEKEDGLYFPTPKDYQRQFEEEFDEYWTIEEAREYTDDNNDKWGQAYAFEIKPTKEGHKRWYVAGWCSS